MFVVCPSISKYNNSTIYLYEIACSIILTKAVICKISRLYKNVNLDSAVNLQKYYLLCAYLVQYIAYIYIKKYAYLLKFQIKYKTYQARQTLARLTGVRIKTTLEVTIEVLITKG